MGHGTAAGRQSRVGLRDLSSAKEVRRHDREEHQVGVHVVKVAASADLRAHDQSADEQNQQHG